MGRIAAEIIDDAINSMTRKPTRSSKAEVKDPCSGCKHLKIESDKTRIYSDICYSCSEFYISQFESAKDNK